MDLYSITESHSKSILNPEGAGKATVPTIIHALYSAPILYPGEGRALFERLLEDLAQDLAPADLIQWYLVADLRAVILDEGRYRKMLAIIMSPKELFEPEKSPQEIQFKLQDQAETLYTRREVITKAPCAFPRILAQSSLPPMRSGRS